MKVPAAVLDNLKCSSCNLHLSQSPVYLQHDGTALCGRCFTPKHSAMRNTQYEATVKLLQFPFTESHPKHSNIQHPAIMLEHPTRRACDYQGCAHSDIYKKCLKHQWYFCQQSTYCNICEKKLSRGSLSAHYRSAHADRTYRSGCRWRAIQTGYSGRYCLVSGSAGTAMCQYWMWDWEGFELEVFIPVANEQLREFRCVVQITNPDTGHERTYMPDVQCYGDWDWRIEVKKEDFESWSGELNVSVAIDKID